MRIYLPDNMADWFIVIGLIALAGAVIAVSLMVGR